MALPLTFAEVKAQVLLLSRPLGTCAAFHQAVNAGDYPALIAAAMAVSTVDINPLLWLLKSGGVTDALISDVDQTALNAAGIYATGSVSLLNPAGDITIIGTAAVTVTLTGVNAVNIWVGRNASLVLEVNDTAFAEIKTFDNSSISITVNDTGTLCFTAKDHTTTIITINDTSNSTVEVRNYTGLTLNANGTSFAKVTGFQNAAMAINTTGTPTIIQTAYQGANFSIPTT
ncbi:hypothetical protein [Deminuibacter soli]|uniref:Uncharacterized protein n=1 Tax=Deminuibacter soli TaxID=2291815 RepID=A0A3E1NQF3_9BACT|nr:hypothetical protein [Deminuibacter soli]RFM30028.1 hypothetical protein DXN05_03390 [Deminuibacter soli]